MYVPRHFMESDNARLRQYIRDYSFGLLIVADDMGIEANHVPFYLCADEAGSIGRLQCHLARNNPVWQRLQHGAPVLAVFQGPDAYVSPSWYPTKADTGRVVPTWNYLAVHARGSARVFQDAVWLREHIGNLTTRHESAFKKPWSVDDAPLDFIESMMQAIVGLEIEIESLSGKLKASQNQPEQNRAGVRAALESAEQTNQRAMAKLIP